MSRTYKVIDTSTVEFTGFDQHYKTADIIAVADFEGSPEVWAIDNEVEAMVELHKFYKHTYDTAVIVRTYKRLVGYTTGEQNVKEFDYQAIDQGGQV